MSLDWQTPPSHGKDRGTILGCANSAVLIFELANDYVFLYVLVLFYWLVEQRYYEVAVFVQN